MTRDRFYTDLFDFFHGYKEVLRQEVERHGLSFSHMITLRVLKDGGAYTMGQLTERLCLTHGASTGVIDRLTKLGYVQRTPVPDDRRVVQVSLTPRGEEFMTTLQDEILRQFDQIFSAYDEETWAKVTQGMSLIASAFQAFQTPTREDAISCNK